MNDHRIRLEWLATAVFCCLSVYNAAAVVVPLNSSFEGGFGPVKIVDPKPKGRVAGTLPVEWDASARAKRAMVTAGLVTPREQKHAAAVLNAAFLTYVASALTAILTLLYYLVRSGLLGGSGDD